MFERQMTAQRAGMEKQMAVNIARMRDMLYFTGTFYSLATVGLIHRRVRPGVYAAPPLALL